MIGSDFVEQPAPYRVACSECHIKIPKGQIALVSMRYGRVQKRVCSEACRQTFDDRYWQDRAHERAKPGEERGEMDD